MLDDAIGRGRWDRDRMGRPPCMMDFHHFLPIDAESLPRSAEMLWECVPWTPRYGRQKSTAYLTMNLVS